MGSTYEGMIKCPYCKSITEFYYAPSSGFTKSTCDHCKKEFKISMGFTGEKIIEKNPIRRIKNLIWEREREQRKKAKEHNPKQSQTQLIKYLRHLFIADYLNELRREIR